MTLGLYGARNRNIGFYYWISPKNINTGFSTLYNIYFPKQDKHMIFQVRYFVVSRDVVHTFIHNKDVFTFQRINSYITSSNSGYFWIFLSNAIGRILQSNFDFHKLYNFDSYRRKVYDGRLWRWSNALFKASLSYQRSIQNKSQLATLERVSAIDAVFKTSRQCTIQKESQLSTNAPLKTNLS